MTQAQIFSIGDMTAHEFAKRAVQHMAEINMSLQALADEQPDVLLFVMQMLIAERHATDTVIQTVQATKLTRFAKVWQ